MSVLYGRTFDLTNLDTMKCFNTISAGYPFFSYNARKNIGSMMITIAMTATVTDVCAFKRKKDGTPRSAATPKQMICRFVRFKKILVLTRERSRGTGT